MADGQALNTSDMRKNLLLHIIKSLPTAIHQETLHMVCRVIADRLDKAHLQEDPFHSYFFRRDYRTAYCPLLDQDLRDLLTEGLIRSDDLGNISVADSHQEQVDKRLNKLQKSTEKQEIILTTATSVVNNWDEWEVKKYFPATVFTGHNTLASGSENKKSNETPSQVSWLAAFFACINPLTWLRLAFCTFWEILLLARGWQKKRRFLLGNWYEGKEIITPGDVKHHLDPKRIVLWRHVYLTLSFLALGYALGAGFIALPEQFWPVYSEAGKTTSVSPWKYIKFFWGDNTKTIILGQLAVVILAFTPIISIIQHINRVYGAVVYRWLTVARRLQGMVYQGISILSLIVIAALIKIIPDDLLQYWLSNVPYLRRLNILNVYIFSSLIVAISIMIALLLCISLLQFKNMRFWMDARGMLADVLKNLGLKTFKPNTFSIRRISCYLKQNHLHKRLKPREKQTASPMRSTMLGRQAEGFMRNISRARLESSQIFAHSMRRLQGANNALQFGNCLAMLKFLLTEHMQLRREVIDANPLKQTLSDIMDNPCAKAPTAKYQELHALAGQLCKFIMYSYSVHPRALFTRHTTRKKGAQPPQRPTAEQWWLGTACEHILQSAIRAADSHSVLLVIDALMDTCRDLVPQPPAYPWVWTTNEFGHILFNMSCATYAQEDGRLALMYSADQFFNLLNSSMDTYFRKEMNDFLKLDLTRNSVQFPLLIEKHFERRIQIVELTMHKVFSAVLSPCMLSQIDKAGDLHLFRKYVQHLCNTFVTARNGLLRATRLFLHTPALGISSINIRPRSAQLAKWLLDGIFPPPCQDPISNGILFIRQASTRLRRLTESFCGSMLGLGMQLSMNNHESLLNAYMEILLSHDVQIPLGIMDQFATAANKNRLSEFGAYTFDETYTMTHLWEFFIRFTAYQYNRFTDVQKNVLLNKNIVALYENLRPWEPAWQNTLLQVKARLESLPDSLDKKSALAEIDNVTSPPKPKEPRMLRRQTLLSCPEFKTNDKNLGRIIHSHQVRAGLEYTMTPLSSLEDKPLPCDKCDGRKCFVFYVNDREGNFKFRRSIGNTQMKGKTVLTLSTAGTDFGDFLNQNQAATKPEAEGWDVLWRKIKALRKSTEPVLT